jgi:hypothetical protein
VSGDTVDLVNAPTWLLDSVRIAVQPSGAETADWYETPDEFIVVIRGREFVMYAARLPPGSGVPRGPVLVLRYSRDDNRISVALPSVEPDLSTVGDRRTLPLSPTDATR